MINSWLGLAAACPDYFSPPARMRDGPPEEAPPRDTGSSPVAVGQGGAEEGGATPAPSGLPPGGETRD